MAPLKKKAQTAALSVYYSVESSHDHLSLHRKKILVDSGACSVCCTGSNDILEIQG